MNRFRLLVVLNVTLLIIAIASSRVGCAAMLTTGFFSGTIERFDSPSGPSVVFASATSANDPFPGLAGIAINPVNGQVFVSARISERIYSFNGNTGALLGFQQLPTGSAPAGLTFNSNGVLYVSNFGANSKHYTR